MSVAQVFIADAAAQVQEPGFSVSAVLDVPFEVLDEVIAGIQALPNVLYVEEAENDDGEFGSEPGDLCVVHFCAKE